MLYDHLLWCSISKEIKKEKDYIGQNKEFSDDDVAQVLSFIRSSWGNKGKKISASDITNTRNKFKDREKAFTIEELSKLKQYNDARVSNLKTATK